MLGVQGDAGDAVNLNRRQFLSRGALLAAGGLAIPPWAQWLGEQMEKLQPKQRVFYREPKLLWTIREFVHDEVVVACAEEDVEKALQDLRARVQSMQSVGGGGECAAVGWSTLSALHIGAAAALPMWFALAAKGNQEAR